MTENAFAKLNLSLDVVGKREDGYHDMRMVMQSVELSDTLEVSLTDGVFRAETNRRFIPCDDRNVAVKAARAFFAAAGIEARGALIRITKRIPVCAGLGGGSSDAAAVLRALNRLCSTGFTQTELESIGDRVGSDVPFCVAGGTALAEGKGERLTALKPLPRTAAVICMPSFSASTPELFARIDSKAIRCRPDTAGLIRELETGSLPRMARRMYNVFEDVLDSRKAAISELKNALLDEGALGAAMSGTGSAVFGLFPDEKSALAAYERLSGSCRERFITHTTGALEI